MTDAPGQDQPSLEQQVELLKRQLREAQRLTALGELVSTTTHEFNNVLMTIINYAKLGMRHKDEPSRDKAFDKILSAGHRASKITATVLGLARNRSEGLEPTDLAKLFDDALVLLDREMSKYRITIDRQFGDVPLALANGNQIQQVLLNLLINARQAMSSGGTLIVRLEHKPDEQMVQIVVRDNGCGIPADKLPRIFDSFYSTKDGPDASGKGGTGLGLSMCRSIVEGHRGKIRVDSTVGVGTAFTIKLPVAEQPTAGAPAPSLGIPTSQINSPAQPPASA